MGGRLPVRSALKRTPRAVAALAGATVLVGTAVAVPRVASAFELTAANSSATQAAPRPHPELAEYYRQKVDWAPCVPDPGTPPDFWKGVQCATLTVPMDYRNPANGNLRIAVSRIPATNPATRLGVLLLNPGGPGGVGLDLPTAFRNNAIAGSYDLIGFDPRGVGRSTELSCEVTADPDRFLTRPTNAQMRVMADQARRREQACQRAGGGMRPFVNTASTARDMDVIRGALREKKLNYLGFSYGTYLGAVYGSLFPGNLNRSVLDSSVHPDWIWHEQSKRVAVAARQNVDAWGAWVAQRDKTYHLGSSVARVRATLDALGTRLATSPVALPPPLPAGFPKEIDRNFFDFFLGEVARYRSAWDFLTDMVLEIRKAALPRPDGTLSADAAKALRVLTAYTIPETVNGVFQTVTCEADWPRALSVYYTDMRRFRTRYPFGYGAMAAAPTECTFRSFTPAEPLVGLRRNGYPTGLVIQAEGDGNTQYDGGPAMAGRLNDHLISVPDDGSHGLYARNPCVTQRIDDYLVSGVLPPSRSICPGEKRPAVPADDAPGAGRSLAKRPLESQAREVAAWQELDRRF